MTGFLAAAVAMVAMVLAYLFKPFYGKRPDAAVSRSAVNIAILREQLVRLDAERAQGMIGEDDYRQARSELQRRVLEDTQQSDEPAATLQRPTKTVLGIALLVPALATGLYLRLGSPDGIDRAATQAQASQDIDRMVAGLAQKLEQEPDNLKGWAMLARSYKVLGRSIEAEKAYDRAEPFLENDAQALAEYADLAASNAKGNFEGKPQRLIDKALKADPKHPMALWLAGTAAYRRGDAARAIQLWEQLTALLPPDSDDARMLQGAIEDARALGAPAAGAQKSTTSSKNAPGNVGGMVTLAPALQARRAPDDVLMVIARPQGKRMPVAVLRLPAAQLPFKFTLDDSLAMSPEARISSTPVLEIEARLSRSGEAKAQAGDLVSPVQTVKLGAQGLALQVDRVLP